MVKLNDLEPTEKIAYEEQRAIERELGMHITGEADVHHPAYLFGIVTLGGRWYLAAISKIKPSGCII